MYIFKNAIRSISRSKGRNILMGIIVLVIAISTCVALSIREAAAEAEESIGDSIEITAQISVDRKALMESAGSDSTSDDSTTNKEAMKNLFTSASSLTIDEMLGYAEADSVDNFYYTVSASMNGSDTFEAIDSTSTESSDANSQNTDTQTQVPTQNGQDTMTQGPGAGRMGTQGDFTVIGYSSDEAMTDFISGVCTITEGAIFEEGTTDNVCVISDELALYNSLNVGDSIILTNPNNESETITLTIVGIYNNSESTTTSENVMGGFQTSTDSANQIFMSYNALSAITANSEANATVTTDDEGNTSESTALRSQVAGTYVFADQAAYENFESEARDLGLSDTYTISSSDLTAYENSLQPLQNLSKFATYFLIVVLIVGGIILVVLNIFNIRERKYEIGVLTAIGMKKSKVALQFISELFVVTILSIIIGTCVGAAVSVPVTNSLLESQVESQEAEVVNQSSNFGRDSGAAPSDRGSVSSGTMGSTTNYISEVSSATNSTVVIQLMGIGILLTLLASFAAVLSILRYEPLKILTSRD